MSIPPRDTEQRNVPLPPSRQSSLARRQPLSAVSDRETLRAELNHHISRVARRSTPEALANADSRLALSLRLVLLADALYEAGTRGSPDEWHRTDAERRVRSVMRQAFRGEAKLVERELAAVAGLPVEEQLAFCVILAEAGWRLFDGEPAEQSAALVSVPTKSPPNGRAIVRHGPASYSIDGRPPLTVTSVEDSVLRAFLEHPELDTAALRSKTGVPRPSDVLTRLRKKYGGVFASAIETPRQRGGGNYRVTVRLAG